MNYFAEFTKLRATLPRLALGAVNNINCDYCNYIDRSKDCYLVISGLESEKCLYGKHIFFSYFCLDSAYLDHCNLMYKCLDCKNCYNGNFLQDCEDCTDCEYGFSLRGCQNCFMCTNLRQKKYYIFNQPYEKDEYEKTIRELKNESVQHLNNEFKKWESKNPHPMVQGENNEDSTGHHISNNRNVQNCFETMESQDCAHSTELFKSNDCIDVFIGDFSKWNYMCVSAYYLENSNFCYNCWESSDLEYCDQCYHCNDCFFCCNLNHKKYCIFNQTYEKEAYFRKKNEIIAEMKKEGSYGKMFSSTYQFKDTLAAN